MTTTELFSSSVLTARDTLQMPTFVSIKLLSHKQLESSDDSGDPKTDCLKTPYYLVVEQGEPTTLSPGGKVTFLFGAYRN